MAMLYRFFFMNGARKVTELKLIHGSASPIRPINGTPGEAIHRIRSSIPGRMDSDMHFHRCTHPAMKPANDALVSDASFPRFGDTLG